jgi:hypothetical protein
MGYINPLAFVVVSTLLVSSTIASAKDPMRVGSKVVVGGAPLFTGGTCANIKASHSVAPSGAFGKIIGLIECDQIKYVIVKYKSGDASKISIFSVGDTLPVKA